MNQVYSANAGVRLSVNRAYASAPGSDRRYGEPVTLGLPMPAGLCAEAATLQLCDDRGLSLASQTRVLERWSDGTIRWVLVHCQATVDDEDPDEDAPTNGRQLLGWAAKQQPDAKGLVMSYGKRNGLKSKIVDWTPDQVDAAYRFARSRPARSRRLTPLRPHRVARRRPHPARGRGGRAATAPARPPVPARR